MRKFGGTAVQLLGTTALAAMAMSAPAWAADAAAAEQAAQTASNTGESRTEAVDEGSSEIVVTARLRNETLLDVPVAVSALSADDITRYNASDLTNIGELTPTVIISNYRTIGGGSLSIRGISSPPTQVGYEQPVSVAIDGVQSSSGRVATLGFFDLQQVEILKGPQALFFGKTARRG